MNAIQKGLVVAAVAGSTFAGGALGAGAFGAGAATKTTTTTTSSSGGSNQGAPPSGTFHPNEDAQHEAGESAAREAQEDAGQFPTVP
jgi:hypothetical protein